MFCLIFSQLKDFFLQISAYVGFLSKWAIASPGSFAFVSGVAPPTISALFGFFLPIVMRWLSKFQGALTHSR
jgi:hypothetical protein